MKKTKILRFIDLFHPEEDVMKSTFSEGMCYWFAYILKGRFPSGKIVYEPVLGHFLFKYSTHLYDISGNVTEKFKGCVLYDIEWISQYEPFWYRRILEGCILKIH